MKKQSGTTKANVASIEARLLTSNKTCRRGGTEMRAKKQSGKAMQKITQTRSPHDVRRGTI
jgi:hypothetical protein